MSTLTYHTREQLEAMKRPELQALAKLAGEKANKKSSEIIESLVQLFEEMKSKEQSNGSVSAVTATPAPALPTFDFSAPFSFSSMPPLPSAAPAVTAVESAAVPEPEAVQPMEVSSKTAKSESTSPNWYSNSPHLNRHKTPKKSILKKRQSTFGAEPEPEAPSSTAVQNLQFQSDSVANTTATADTEMTAASSDYLSVSTPAPANVTTAPMAASPAQIADPRNPPAHIRQPSFTFDALIVPSEDFKADEKAATDSECSGEKLIRDLDQRLAEIEAKAREKEEQRKMTPRRPSMGTSDKIAIRDDIMRELEARLNKRQEEGTLVQVPSAVETKEAEATTAGKRPRGTKTAEFDDAHNKLFAKQKDIFVHHAELQQKKRELEASAFKVASKPLKKQKVTSTPAPADTAKTPAKPTADSSAKTPMFKETSKQKTPAVALHRKAAAARAAKTPSAAILPPATPLTATTPFAGSTQIQFAAGVPTPSNKPAAKKTAPKAAATPSSNGIFGGIFSAVRTVGSALGFIAKPSAQPKAKTAAAATDKKKAVKKATKKPAAAEAETAAPAPMAEDSKETISAESAEEKSTIAAAATVDASDSKIPGPKDSTRVPITTPAPAATATAQTARRKSIRKPQATVEPELTATGAANKENEICSHDTEMNVAIDPKTPAKAKDGVTKAKRTPGAVTGPKFDLDASLAKPITWKMKTGKYVFEAEASVLAQNFDAATAKAVLTAHEAPAAEKRAKRQAKPTTFKTKDDKRRAYLSRARNDSEAKVAKMRMMETLGAAEVEAQ